MQGGILCGGTIVTGALRRRAGKASLGNIGTTRLVDHMTCAWNVSILINIRYLLCDAKELLLCTINQYTSINVLMVDEITSSGKDCCATEGILL